MRSCVRTQSCVRACEFCLCVRARCACARARAIAAIAARDDDAPRHPSFSLAPSLPLSARSHTNTFRSHPLIDPLHPFPSPLLPPAAPPYPGPLLLVGQRPRLLPPRQTGLLGTVCGTRGGRRRGETGRRRVGAHGRARRGKVRWQAGEKGWAAAGATEREGVGGGGRGWRWGAGGQERGGRPNLLRRSAGRAQASGRGVNDGAGL